MLPSVVILGIVALAAAFLARSRLSLEENAVGREAAAYSLIGTVAFQSLHFAEEAATGFHERFPALFGQAAMPLSIFVAFNVAWIVIWVASIPGLRSNRAIAFFAAWFLAIAGMLNGIAHPLMAVVAGGYFPGLITSPFIGLASVWLWRRLCAATNTM